MKEERRINERRIIVTEMPNKSLEKLKFKIGNFSKNTKFFNIFKTFETKEKFV